MAMMMLYYGYAPAASIAVLPVFVVLAFATAFGSGLWVSALMVRYRDFRYIVPFVVQFGLYVSPVGFSSSVVPEQWRWLYSINPMVGVIDGFRWAIIGEQNLYWPGFFFSVAGVVFLIITGIWYFRRTERTFADVI
jgi:lipopolysaccharide transport system permease protein